MGSWTSLGAVLYQEAGDFDKAQRLWRRYLDMPGASKTFKIIQANSFLDQVLGRKSL